MKANLAVLALAATAVVAAPTPVQKDVVAREAAPAPAPTDFGSYGEYGTYGTYESYPSSSPSPTPTPTPSPPATFTSYGTYTDYPPAGSYATYSNYKRAVGDLIKKFWSA